MSGRRSIFEEVDKAPVREAPKGGMIDQGRKGARGAIRAWLLVLFTLVVLMIAVGGLTRLTDSGLSITEWKPVTGALPPMSAADWDAEFAKYKEIPEFQVQNSWMELNDFKRIYWWEWGHRQLGRVIGLVWAIGFLFFLATRKIPTGWTQRLLLLGVLGGIQGAVGWWMVASGLGAGMTDVASYRLATHLGLAFVILGFIAWYVFLLGRDERELMQARRGKEAKLFRAEHRLAAFHLSANSHRCALVAGHRRRAQLYRLAVDGGADPYHRRSGWPNWAGVTSLKTRGIGSVYPPDHRATCCWPFLSVVVFLRGRRSAPTAPRAWLSRRRLLRFWRRSPYGDHDRRLWRAMAGGDRAPTCLPWHCGC